MRRIHPLLVSLVGAIAIGTLATTVQGQSYFRSATSALLATSITLTGPGSGASITNPTTNNLTTSGSFTVSGDITAAAANYIGFTGRSFWKSTVNGSFSAVNAADSIGVQLKFDALPTVASGFGASPAVTAGSTAFAGSVNVGTGGAATSGVVNFNGTAFPSAPFCTVTPSLTNAVTRPTTVTTTQLTLTTTTAWTASDVVIWQCISAK